MAAVSTSRQSYGTIPPEPSPLCGSENDQSLYSTSFLQVSESTQEDGYHNINPPPTEQSPLISSTVESYSGSTSQSRSDHDRIKRNEGPSYILAVALISLCSLTLLILLIGFLLPEAVQEYSKQAADIQLSSLSVHSFTRDGVRIHIQGQATLDASQVNSFFLKGFGILVGFVARKVKIGSSEALLYLPEYQAGALATVLYPGLVVNLQNGQLTGIDILCEVIPGTLEGITPAIDDLMAGRTSTLTVHIESRIPLTSGILPLGSHGVAQEIILKEPPSLPRLEISRLNLAEIELPGQKALGANVTIEVINNLPVDFMIPPLRFSVMLHSCDRKFIEIAAARTSEIDIRPFKPIRVDVTGVVRSIPFALIEVCPGTGTSPLDDLLGQYVHGQTTTAYVRGLPSYEPDSKLPTWFQEALSSVTIPVPVPGGHAFKDMLKSFTLTDVSFGLPDPDSDPNSPNASPQISATVRAVVRLPQEVNAPLNVSKVIANADISYFGHKLGEFHIPNWAQAITNQRKETHELEISARVEKVPLIITDTEVFSEVVQKIVFGGEDGVKLEAAGTADVSVGIASLGAFVIRGIPAKGDIVIKGGNHSLNDIHPKPKDIIILSSTKASVKLGAIITFHNPTNYTAIIPYLNLRFTKEGKLLGNGTIIDAEVGLGDNNIMVELFWAPADGGDDAWASGMALLSDYVSGKNATISVRGHSQSIPSLPSFSKAIETLEFNIPLPAIPFEGLPHNPPDAAPDRPRFVQSAILHIFTSTGTFFLQNPLKEDTIFISGLSGVASHNSTVLGTLNYTYQFAIPPGLSETPKLPVEYTLDGVGYDIVRKALGGVLKIDAMAHCNIRLGHWQERLNFEGNGIGAHVKL